MKQGLNSVILIGMPGSGKTTVGAALSKKTGLQFLDTDSLIEESEKRKISEIFKKDGEEYFRNLETGVIKSLLNSYPIVLSTGGGIVERDENIELLKKIGKVFYLEISPDLILERIKGDKTRPLLQKDDPMKALKDLYLRRHKKYSLADFKIDASNSIELITDEIYEKING